MENKLRRILAEQARDFILHQMHGEMPHLAALLADYDELRRENDELRRENDELRCENDELRKLTARMSEGDKASAFLASLPSMITDDAELRARIDEAYYAIQGDEKVWCGLSDLPHEEWHCIEGFDERYQVSNYGRVKSFFSRKVKILPGNFSLSTGYICNRLYGVDGKSVSVLVHRLVAQAFIPNPDGKPFVNHKDGTKTNNRVGNLEWVTNGENMVHAYRMGLRRMGRLTFEQVRYIRENPDGLTQKELGALFALGQDGISRIQTFRWYKNVK